MPIEVGLWKLGDRPVPVSFEPMESESRLEDLLAQDIGVADPNLLLIGRQVPTAHGKFIDLLAEGQFGSRGCAASQSRAKRWALASWRGA